MYDPLNPPFFFEDVWGDKSDLEGLPGSLAKICSLLENRVPTVDLENDTVNFNFPISHCTLESIGVPNDSGFPSITFSELTLEIMKDRLRYVMEELQRMLLHHTPSNQRSLAVFREMVERSDRSYRSETGFNFGQSAAIRFGLSPSFGYHPVRKQDILNLRARYGERPVPPPMRVVRRWLGDIWPN